MKKRINNIANWRTLVGMLVVTGLFSLHSCGDDEAMKWVDLRYKAGNTYTLEALNPAPITIQVKSTDPWEVFSKHDDWCTISPDKGEPGETFDVQISYNDNNHLDDRIDTITIKSDYWTGKEVIVTQKGTAYLTLEDNEDFVLEEGEGTRIFTVKSNQDWKTAVTTGEEWLSITQGTTGAQNGDVTVKCIENKGEKRIGIVTVYDRHDVARATVQVIQKGLVLDFTQLLYKLSYAEQDLRIAVTSNAEWSVSKDNEDAEWYSFEQTSFNGDGTLVVKLDENPGGAVRKASFTLSTKLIEGLKPITKTVTIKQGNHVIPTIHEFDDAEKGRWTLNNGVVNFANGDITCTVGRLVQYKKFDPGYYEFRVKSMTSGARAVLFFVYGTKEIRWHLNMGTGKTEFSLTSNTSVSNQNVNFDKTKGSYTLGLNLLKADNGKYKVEWSLDGVLLHTYNGDEEFDIDYDTKADIYVGSNLETAVFDWWSYSQPIDWGDE